MIIGSFKVEDMNGNVIHEDTMNNFSVTGNVIYIQCQGGLLSSIPFSNDSIYKLKVHIQNTGDYVFTAIFLDYMFNAGSSEYVDENGVTHDSVVVLSNQIQFKKIG